MTNKRVRNAVSCEYNGVSFDSKLELKFAKALSEAGIKWKREPFSINLIEPFIFRGHPVKACVYQVDFIVEDYYFVEVKGFMLPEARLKMKLFKKYLVDRNITNPVYIIKTKPSKRNTGIPEVTIKQFIQIVKDEISGKNP